MMTDVRKAMEMALEALSARTIAYSTAWREQRTAAINALKAELAALKAQEPVAEVKESAPINPLGQTVKAAFLFNTDLPAGAKLYAAPVPAQSDVVECDCTMQIHANGDKEAYCGSSQMKKAVEAGYAFQLKPAQSVNAEMVEVILKDARNTGREIFKDSCNHAKDAIEWFYAETTVELAKVKESK